MEMPGIALLSYGNAGYKIITCGHTTLVQYEFAYQLAIVGNVRPIKVNRGRHTFSICIYLKSAIGSQRKLLDTTMGWKSDAAVLSLKKESSYHERTKEEFERDAQIFDIRQATELQRPPGINHLLKRVC
jgi:hypothetical protein